MHHHSYRILFFPVGDEGGGRVVTPTPTPTPSDPGKGFEALMAKHNSDALRVAEKLYDDNHTLREKLRDTRGKVPADGSVVLSPDEAKAWSEYLKLGKAEDVKASLDQGKAATGELAKSKQAEFHQAVAETLGWKPSLTSDILAKHSLTPELKDENDRGKAVKVAYVQHEGKSVKLADFVKERDPDYLAVLPTGSKVGPARPNAPPGSYVPNAPPPAPGSGDPIQQAYQEYVRSGAAAF